MAHVHAVIAIGKGVVEVAEIVNSAKALSDAVKTILSLDGGDEEEEEEGHVRNVSVYCA